MRAFRPVPLAALVCALAVAGCATAAGDEPSTADAVVAGDAPQRKATTAEPVLVVDGMYAVSPDGLALTVQVPVGGACSGGGTPSAEAAESSEEVVLAVTVTRERVETGQGPCWAGMGFYDVKVPLSRPLSERRVVESASGRVLQRRP